MVKRNNVQFYLNASQVLLGLLAFGYLMYAGRKIIVPLIFALIIAILLNPLVKKLERKGINRTIAILAAVVLAVLLIAGLFYFIGSQAAMLTDALPQLKQNIHLLFNDCIKWISQTFNISRWKVNEWVNQQQTESLSNGTEVIGQTLTTITGVVIMAVLLPVYIFLFLFYKNLLLEFIARLFPPVRHNAIEEVLTETKSLIQSYLVGLLIEAAIVAALNTAGLLALGMDYALLIGVIGALLNLIPYIGGLIATALPMALALATKEPIYVLYVFLVYIAVQFIDNNLIVPRIVASKIKINALVSVIVVLIGEAIWGVPGMFLALPLTAIVKVVFDRINPLKPIGFLIGDGSTS